MVCTLGNLAITGEKDYFLVVGLPIIQCKTSMQDKLRNTILGCNNCEVIYRSKQFKPRMVISGELIYTFI